MNFALAKTIQNLGGHIHHNSFNVYLNTPSTDFINPGFNLQLYTDIVPTNNNIHGREVQKEKATEDELPPIEEKNILQKGSGNDDELIESSFQHPRPIRTEIIDAFQQKNDLKKSAKRSNTGTIL